MPLAWLQDFARDAMVAADGCTYEREAFEASMQHSSTAAGKGDLRPTQPFQNRLYSTVVGMLLKAH